MRIAFFWDDPTIMLGSIFFQLALTIAALTFALSLAILARRRVRRGASASPLESSLGGADFAAEILKAGAVDGWTIVRARGPLANFADPSRRELRLSEKVAEGRTPGDLAIAAHQAGHALDDSRKPWRSGVRVPLILGSKLANIAAWLTLLAGVLMLSPALTDRGSALLALVVLIRLVEQSLFENEANRRAMGVIREAGLDEGWSDLEKVAFEKALRSTRWVEMASTLPLP